MRRRASIVPVVCTALFMLLAYGCATPAPTTQSAGKFVHIEEEEEEDTGGQVTASHGLTIASETLDDADETDWTITGVLAEASFTEYMGESYDLAISSGNGKLNLTGNLVFMKNGGRLGFLHGIGGGYSGRINNIGLADDEEFFMHNIGLDATGGFFFQSADGSEGAVYAAGRYTYGANVNSASGEGAPDFEDEWRDAHFLTANLGVTIPAGGAYVSPEVVGTWGTYNTDIDNRFILTFGVNISAPY